MNQFCLLQHLSLSDTVASASQFKGEWWFSAQRLILNFLSSITTTRRSFLCLTSQLGGATSTPDKLNKYFIHSFESLHGKESTAHIVRLWLGFDPAFRSPSIPLAWLYRVCHPLRVRSHDSWPCFQTL